MKNATQTLKTTVAAGVLATALLSSSAMAAPAGNPNVERRSQAFLEVLANSGGRPLETLPVADARAVLEGAQANAKLPAAEVSRKTITVDGKPVKLVIVKPEGTKGTLPGFMFFHGGGWVLGDYPTHERLIRDIVVASGAVAIYVDYERSPEVRYPVALNQGYGATKWVAEHGDEIGVDGKRLAVVGNSAGGNLATAVAITVAEKGGPKLKAQVLLWPVTDANLETASYKTFAEGHFLTKPMMAWFWDSYAPDMKTRKDRHVAPLQATTDQLKGLPVTLIQTAENDVLRDEGEAYARKLDKAGVDVTVVRYNGMIHDFGLLNALADVPGTRAMITQAGDMLKANLK